LFIKEITSKIDYTLMFVFVPFGKPGSSPSINLNPNKILQLIRDGHDVSVETERERRERERERERERKREGKKLKFAWESSHVQRRMN
jgi:hypothetical protein